MTGYKINIKRVIYPQLLGVSFLVLLSTTTRAQLQGNIITAPMNTPDSLSIFREKMQEPDTSKQKKTSEFYIKLKDNAKKSIVTKELHGLFFRSTRPNNQQQIFAGTDAESKFNAYRGKTIAQVNIIRLDPFGYSVSDTSKSPVSGVERFGNKLHVETRKFTIKNHLLFKPNQQVDPIDFAETEEILRNLSFVEDAYIVLDSTGLSSNLVRVTVITKDVWSIGFDGSISDKDKGRAKIYDKNLAGLGIGFNAYLYYDASNVENPWGQRAELTSSNLYNTFFKGNLSYRHGLGYNTTDIAVQRDFYSSKTKLAGGASLHFGRSPYNFKRIDSLGTHKVTIGDLWAGWALYNKDITQPELPNQFALTTRIKTTYFTDRPKVTPSTNPYFHNKTTYLAGISISRQKLYKANLIYSYGRTEDIPTGFLVSATAGYELGEFENRYYVGTELSAADVGEYGYLYGLSRFGTYINTKGKLEQVTFRMIGTYVTGLFHFQKLDIRQFFRVDFTKGNSRLEGEREYLLLDGNVELRGLNGTPPSGNNRLLISLETLAFSPLYVYGFKFAFFAYTDIGFISEKYAVLSDSPSYSSIGFGVRIRNENLVFSTLQIRLNYFPVLPEGASAELFWLGSESRTRFPNFRPHAPRITPYE